MGLPTKPTFIIIGAQRCATRWLRVNLGLHPDVFALAHEADFFCDLPLMQRVGRAGYRRLFVGWDGEPVVGEASPRYAMPSSDPAEVIGRMANAFPGVRYLMLIRDPYERGFSAMLDAVRTGELPEDTRYDAMDPEDVARLQIIRNSAYEWAIGAYRNVVGDDLKVLVYDDLVADPGAVYDAALEHIGLEPGFRPPDLATPLFSTRRLRESIPAPDPAHRQEVLRFAETSVVNVERMIGRELPGWHPA